MWSLCSNLSIFTTTKAPNLLVIDIMNTNKNINNTIPRPTHAPIRIIGELMYCLEYKIKIIRHRKKNENCQIIYFANGDAVAVSLEYPFFFI